MRFTSIAIVLLFALTTVGCSTAPSSAADRDILVADARAALSSFEELDPDLYAKFNSNAVGVAAFPTIGKGAIGVGGAYGKGVLFEDGAMVGYCDMTQASIGFQLGGQAYTEIIFFEDNGSLRDFRNGNLEFAAQASAVAVTADASANADYDNGVAVFTILGQGLMYEASIGGQKFDFLPKENFE